MTRDELLKLDSETLVDTLLSERADAEKKAADEAEKKRVKLAQIENMPHAKLKDNKADLIAAAAMEPVAELAARFVNARIDAKRRDERMAEMGAEITGLQETVAERDATIESKDALIAKGMDLIAAKDAEIAELNKLTEGEQ